MAYYLYHVSASDASGKYVDFPEVNIATSQDFEFEFEAFSTNSTFFRPFGRVENLNSRCLFLTDNVTIRLTNNTGTNLNWTVPAYTRNNFNVFKFTRASNVITLYINGVASGTPITNNGAFVFSRFFANGASAGITGAMKYFKISIGGSLVRNYVNSTGTGIVWPDIVSAQDGNQVGPWPSDDSEWVFYSSGGAFTLNADGGTFTYSGASASLLANRSLSANGASFSYSGASAALRINRLLQADGASFSYSGASADLLLDRLLSADGGLFSYSGAAAALTYTPITGYVLNADGATFNYVGAEASLSYSQNFPEANPNDFTVSSLVDSSFAYTSSISPTVGFSAMISSTFKYNGSLN